MKVLVACEESQTVCKAFRATGHEAYSCDILPCSGGHPEWHIQADVRTLLSNYFDLVIFHPVCRYISNSGVRWLSGNHARWIGLYDACEFFNLRHKFNSPRVATENPIPHKYAVNGIDDLGFTFKGIGYYDQLFQPWHFGHAQMKATCLWLKNIPPLKYTNVVGPPPKDKKKRYEWQNVWTASPGPHRAKLRSKTYPGIAQAMADQWGNLDL